MGAQRARPPHTTAGLAAAAPRRLVAQLVRRARDLGKASGAGAPPFAPERLAARCGIVRVERAPVPEGARIRAHEPARDGGPRWVLTIHPALPPHTPQWNGAFACALARTLLPPEARGGVADALVEIGAAELLLPMHAFRAEAARTDLTMDGVRELAMRFAAPIRLTVRQWLRAGTWRGFALLWREEDGVLRLRWRAVSPGARLPRTAVIGAPAAAVWSDGSRLYATHRTGRPQHRVEEVRTGAGSAWWFARFGVVRDHIWTPAPRTERAVLALVALG